MGCSSAYLTLHPGRNSTDYDSAGCLKTYNDFAQHHNAVLQHKLQALRAKYPQARIMYADYYGAAMSFAKNPKQFGEYFFLSDRMEPRLICKTDGSDTEWSLCLD